LPRRVYLQPIGKPALNESFCAREGSILTLHLHHHRGWEGAPTVFVTNYTHTSD
jgi:hypothetical protein